jgi:hypothetical protein
MWLGDPKRFFGLSHIDTSSFIFIATKLYSKQVNRFDIHRILLDVKDELNILFGVGTCPTSARPQTWTS